MNKENGMMDFELTDSEREWFHAPYARDEFRLKLKNELWEYIMQNNAGRSRKKSFNLPFTLKRSTKIGQFQSNTVSGIIAILAIFLLITGVAYAVSNYFGYVPGFGMINQDTTVKVLASSAQQTQDGIQLNLVSVVTDVNTTSVVYSLKGLPSDLFEDPASLTPEKTRCRNEVWLELPDGQKFDLLGSGSLGYGVDNVYQKVAFFSPLPDKVDHATFKMACIEGTYPGKAPENWAIPFSMAESTDLNAYPVLIKQQNMNNESKNSLYITNVIPVEDRVIILGRYIPVFDDIYELTLSDVSFMDGNGKHLAYKTPGDLQYFTSDEIGRFAYIVEATASTFPITMQVGKISFLCWGDATFDIDISTLQPGSTIDLEDQFYKVGSCSLQLASLSSDGSKIRMKMASDGYGITYLSVHDKDDRTGPIAVRISGNSAVIDLDVSQIGQNNKTDLELSGVGLVITEPIRVEIKLEDYK